jgi:hypothetical protein
LKVRSRGETAQGLLYDIGERIPSTLANFSGTALSEMIWGSWLWCVRRMRMKMLPLMSSGMGRFVLLMSVCAFRSPFFALQPWKTRQYARYSGTLGVYEKVWLLWARSHAVVRS